MLRGGLAGSVVAMALLIPPGANASTFTVDTERDLLDANQVDGVCAAANGKCSVRAATMAANGNPGLDDIVIPAGTYELTQPPDDSASSLEGDLDLDEAVTIDGAGAGRTIIRQTVSDRVITSNAQPAGLLPGAIVTDLTITGGRLAQGGNMLGGGVRVDDFLFAVGGVRVRDNKIVRRGANSFGGGIAALGPATLIVQESRVSGNAINIRNATASAVGGGIFLEGELGSGSPESTITDSVIVDNVARVKGGGTGTGGGLYARDPVTISRAELSGNRADEGGGLTITQFFEGAQVFDTSIVGNRATKGGGVNVSTLGSGSVALTNSTISQNELSRGAGRGGGALHVTSGDISMKNVTVADNDSGRRGAIALESASPTAVQMNLPASIVDGAKRDCRGVDEDFLAELSIFGDASCVPPTISTNQVADPRLKPLADNPGAFGANLYGPTHIPKASSPAIGFAATGCPPPSQDQLGFTRTAPCDAGAVERQ